MYLNFLFSQQTLFLNFAEGSTQLFKKNIYSFGLSSNKQYVNFIIYKLSPKLRIEDSLVIDLGKGMTENYLKVYSDTLHDFLNIYLQKKEQKDLTILRFDKHFKLIANLKNVDIARVNTIINFENEFLIGNKGYYAVKIINDTSGKQFYLNKFSLKSELTNFEYELTWQFPFEKKNIHSAHVFFENERFVLLFVNITKGIKLGQWLLKINSETGKLIKATKLNTREEKTTYEYGNCLIDTNAKTIQLIGQKFDETRLNLAENKLSISNLPFADLYFIEIDSLGEKAIQKEIKIPITDIKSGAKKIASSYLLRINKLIKNPICNFSFESDIFKSQDNSKSFFYTNTQVFNFSLIETDLVLEKKSISSNLQIEQFYQTKDKLDLNGKLFLDSISDLEKIFYKKLTLPVKQQFKTDDDTNPSWILSKSSTKNNIINFTFLVPANKIYQLLVIEEILKSQNPIFINATSKSFILSTQQDLNLYCLKLFNW